MKYLLTLFAFILYWLNLNAQEKSMVDQGLTQRNYQIAEEELYSPEVLPLNIKSLLDSFTTHYFGKYSGNINFIRGKIFDIKNGLQGNTVLTNEFNLRQKVIPKYELFYTFADTSLGIKKYWITIAMDQYGQVLNCSFPKLLSTDLLVPLNDALMVADSLAYCKYPSGDISNCKTDMEYLYESACLCWTFCYIMNEKPRSHENHCFFIDARTSKFIKEAHFTKCWMVAGDHEKCLPEPRKYNLVK
ncbi:hypothetical protein OAO55_01255 [Bacteroidales bacterium]|nr:hypothetical protein [Bacteroidales bacterium]